MNLILSDVEETMMIVGEGTDGTVNVGLRISPSVSHWAQLTRGKVARRKMDMLFVRGDGVILVRMFYCHCVHLPTYPRYPLHRCRDQWSRHHAVNCAQTMIQGFRIRAIV